MSQRVDSGTEQPAEIEHHTRTTARWLYIALIALVLGGLYGFTLAPSITWSNYGEDSGELAAAVATLGIPHPPGYPTYTLLGFLWSRLPIGGDVAFRLNWLSAVCSIIAAATLIALTAHITRSGRSHDLSKIWGGLFFAIAPLVWSQSIITEVYAVGAGFLGLITLACVKLSEKPTNTGFFAAGVLTGLSFGVVPQLIVVAPFIVIVGIVPGGNLRVIINRVSCFALGLLVGLLPFLYLPLRAMAKPLFNWGMAVTWQDLWWLVTAAQYHHLAGIPDWQTGIQRLLESADLLLRQIPYWGILFIVLSLRSVWRTHRLLCLYFLALVCFSVLLKINYSVLNNDVYLIPSVYVLCLLLGIGAANLHKQLKQRFLRLGLVCVLVVGWSISIIRSMPDLNRQNDHTALEFTHRVFAELPQDAVVFSNRDDTTFALWYGQALGHRPDILIIDTRLLLYSWYQENLAHHHPEVNRNLLRPGAVTGLQQAQFSVEGQFPDFMLTSIDSNN